MNLYGCTNLHIFMDNHIIHPNQIVPKRSLEYKHPRRYETILHKNISQKVDIAVRFL